MSPFRMPWWPTHEELSPCGHCDCCGKQKAAVRWTRLVVATTIVVTIMTILNVVTMVAHFAIHRDIDRRDGVGRSNPG